MKPSEILDDYHDRNGIDDDVWSELRAISIQLEAENARLRGEWEKEEYRCPQCGTGNPKLAQLEKGNASARAIMQKFVDKVDRGTARSTETYAEMKQWMEDCDG